jgi:metal-responsive CopG/Arc/MetJ family transcriptional regulator
MKRTQIYLPDTLIRKLEVQSKEKGFSKGEVIRIAIEEYFKGS